MVLIIIIIIIVIICVIVTLFTWIAEQLSATPTNFTENEKIVYSYLKENTDYGNTQIAAIMGNLKAELSSIDPTYDTGNVLGIMQWTGASRSTIVGWAQANNKDVYTLETQLEYATTVYIPNSWRFPSSYTGKKAYPSSYNISYTQWQALGEEDIDLATAAFCACSEKPYYYNSNIDSLRIPYARTYLASIKAQQNADPNAPTSSDIAYVQYALNMAADDSIGYSQQRRNRNPDVDCSSFVAWALKDAGYNITPVNMNTGNQRATLTRLGFSVLSYNPSILKPGDILWRRSGSNGHTEIYVGNGYLVGASNNNINGVDYSAPGDQTGLEVRVTTLYNDGWTLIFRKSA